MPLTETPALLILGTEAEYISRLQTEYHGKVITIPEGKNVVFYLSQENNCKHCICGREQNGMFKPFNPMRAQRILWIKFLLENQTTRTIKKSLANGNLAFICDELKYVVICSVLPRGDLKFITQYIVSGDEMKKFNNINKYVDHTFV